MNILDQLAEHARQRVEAAKQTLPLAEIKRQALSLPKGDFRFEKALAKPGLAFICECKKASPSKGLIAPEFPYLQIAKEYEAAGADAIDVEGCTRVQQNDVTLGALLACQNGTGDGGVFRRGTAHKDPWTAHQSRFPQNAAAGCL